MKKLTFYIFLLLVAMSSGCKDKFTEIFTANSPIYMSYEDLRLAVKQSAATDLVNPGKIYFKDQFIFIVEEMKGIHVFDNTDPANPINQTFVEVPGNADIAIKGDILYADSYIDMVAIDISDLTAIKEVGRVQKVLPYTLPPYDDKYPMARIDEEKGVVTGWEIKEVKQEIVTNYYPVYWQGGFNKYTDASPGTSTGGVSPNGVGIGGSMARFGIYENTLYAVDNTTLHIFSITVPKTPVFKKDFNAGWGIETMFTVGENMFLGSQSGMRIYDISIPNSPLYITDFWHMTGCDPVVVSGNFAYITLRGGNNCGNNVNQLVVVSIENILKPVELKTYPMEGPYGLGIDNNILFICDGDAGLKVYDVSDPMNINKHLLAQYPDILTYDVIPINGLLIMIGDDGLYQYDYENVKDIKFLSKIGVK
ncbi:MAG: hypothetical protein D4R64_13495 [Porphyromonadaceae bacterium]|nr:MAG: hypothetical protein D4R64_13495 [Porphyromonadaceae bacterium]